MPADQRERSKTTRKRTTRQPENTVDGRGLTWLSDSVVLVAGDLPEPRPRRPQAWFDCPSGRVAASASRIALDGGEDARDDAAVLILQARGEERVTLARRKRRSRDAEWRGPARADGESERERCPSRASRPDISLCRMRQPRNGFSIACSLSSQTRIPTGRPSPRASMSSETRSAPSSTRQGSSLPLRS